MALKAKVGGEFKPIAEGLHPAVCVGVYDLGTQHSPRFNTDAHQVLISWEITDEEREFEGETYHPKVSNTYTVSVNAKSNLRKLIESWRGKKMTDAEAEDFDLVKLAGKPCMVQIVHNSKDGKTYANIAAVVSVPKGTVVPPPTSKVVAFEMGQELPDDLPEWIATKIQSAPEFSSAAKVEDASFNTDDF